MRARRQPPESRDCKPTGRLERYASESPRFVDGRTNQWRSSPVRPAKVARPRPSGSEAKPDGGSGDHWPDHAARRSAHPRGLVKSRRQIPAVSKVLEQISAADLPRPLVVQTIRQELAQARRTKKATGDLVEVVQTALDRLRRSRLQPVINGTGIIVHTNLGRIPLAPDALNALFEAGRTYNNLEFDLNSGTRGGRGQYLERALAALCQAESACVVNNCAAALVLIVHHFTKRKPEVIISRGELVQFGGGFRVGGIL